MFLGYALFALFCIFLLISIYFLVTGLLDMRKPKDPRKEPVCSCEPTETEWVAVWALNAVGWAVVVVLVLDDISF